MKNATIGYRIKFKRMQANMTQYELAEKLGTTKQTIWKYEHDVIDIPIPKIMQLAEILSCTPQYLTDWVEKEKPAEEDVGRQSEEDVKLLGLFHELNYEEQRMVIDFVDAYLKRQK